MKCFRLSHLWDNNELYSRNPKTVRYETELISFLAFKNWSIVPQEIKSCKYLDYLKKASGNRKQFAHFGYVKLTCNMLVLYNKTSSLHLIILSFLPAYDNISSLFLALSTTYTDLILVPSPFMILMK